MGVGVGGQKNCFLSDTESAEKGGLEGLKSRDEFVDPMVIFFVGSNKFIHSFGGGVLVLSMMNRGGCAFGTEKIKALFEFVAKLVPEVMKVILGDSGNGIAAFAHEIWR